MYMKIKNLLILTFFILNAVFVFSQRIDSLFISPNSVTIEIYHNYTTEYVNSNYYISNDTCYLDVCYANGMGPSFTYDSTTIPVNLPTTNGDYTFKLVTSLTQSVGVCDNYYLFDSVTVDFSIPMSEPIILSLEDKINKENINIYPNPINDLVSIQFKGEIQQIDLIDLNGRLIKEFINISKNEVKLSELKKGMYIMKVYTDKGIYTERILKE